jgi:hypothetical protein
MGLLGKIFGSEEVKIVDNRSFWNWFAANEKAFFKTISSRKGVNENFVQPVMDKIQLLNEHFYCVAGMYDEKTAELVVTPEGSIPAIAFVEDLIAAAPSLPGWKFTALKPAIGFDTMSVQMDGYDFDNDHISFCSQVDPEYPDEIRVTLVHKDYTDDNASIISNGCIIYLDNALGELNALTLIDSLEVAGSPPAGADLVPMNKLQDYLDWRQREFQEKYEGTRYNTENDSYSAMEAEDKDGRPALAIFNGHLMEWDRKASHPWMMVITIAFDGKDTNGMPDDDTYQLMDEFEDSLLAKLPDYEGYLNLGRQTYNSNRTIYFACKEFRKPSRVTQATVEQYLEKLDISFEIYKDKYWMTMNQFTSQG